MINPIQKLAESRNNRQRRFATVVLGAAAIVVSGCAATNVSPLDSPLYSPPAGSVVALNKDLEIRKERSRVYIQDGRIFGSIKDVEVYAPWCAIEAHRGGAEFARPFTVKSGAFDVVRSWKGIDYAAVHEISGPLTVAAKVDKDSNRSPRVWVSPIDEDRPMETLATYMQISSIDQPAVKTLVCGVFADSVVYNHLRLSQIQSTLGDVISLSLPSSKQGAN